MIPFRFVYCCFGVIRDGETQVVFLFDGCSEIVSEVYPKGIDEVCATEMDRDYFFRSLDRRQNHAGRDLSNNFQFVVDSAANWYRLISDSIFLLT